MEDYLRQLDGIILNLDTVRTRSDLRGMYVDPSELPEQVKRCTFERDVLNREHNKMLTAPYEHHSHEKFFDAIAKEGIRPLGYGYNAHWLGSPNCAICSFGETTDWQRCSRKNLERITYSLNHALEEAKRHLQLNQEMAVEFGEPTLFQDDIKAAQDRIEKLKSLAILSDAYLRNRKLSPLEFSRLTETLPKHHYTKFEAGEDD